MPELIAKPRYLTKSRFKLAVECPTKLYYTGKSEYRNVKQEDSFLAMLAEGGFQVGELAKLMYPGGHEITSKSHDEAEGQTAELMKLDDVILFEPAIRYGNLFIRVDILVKRNNSVELIEVKAKSYNSADPAIEKKKGGITSEMLPYIQDIAFQTYVFRNAYPEMNVSSSLMMPDKAIKATIDGLNQYFKIEKKGSETKVLVDPMATSGKLGNPILAKVNVSHLVELINAGGVEYPGGVLALSAAAEIWADAYGRDEMIQPVISSQCAKCEFRGEIGGNLQSGFHECWKRVNDWLDEDFQAGTVLDLWNFRGKDEAIQRGARRLSQITQEDIKLKKGDEGLSNTERQWLQISGVPNDMDRGGFYLDVNFMMNQMRGWNFPYHFIDFETASVALPFFKGMAPYGQVAFQFSHHVMKESGEVDHVDQFLFVEPGQFPNYEFAKALKNSLEADDGSVFMWSHHENTILAKILQQLENEPTPPQGTEELADFLKSLIRGGERAMIDLKVIAQKAYFHPSTKGSSSIKKVLPAVLGSSSILREKYSQPIYGAKDGIKSLNYKDFIWWQRNEAGLAIDPYELLKNSAAELLGDEASDFIDAEEFGIAEGGAAATAYSRLQFESLEIKSRELIKKALLRYCELDTLAMAMIVEAWNEWINGNEA